MKGSDPIVLDLVWTRNANRSLAVGLDGATVSGSIFSFLTASGATPETVEFFVDDETMSGAAQRTDTAAPFDLVGGDAVSAVPFATGDLSNGTHTLTARVTLPGSDIRTLTSTFEVDNAPPAEYNVRVSTQSDRAPSEPLDGATVGGDIYVFFAPEEGVSKVVYWIDDPSRTGTPARKEYKAPYDLAGGNRAAAEPFDTTTLTEGGHTITVRSKLLDGTLLVMHSVFTVDQPEPVALRWPGASTR